DLLQPRRGQDHHRSLAAVLQHREATLVAWIQATGTRGHHLACASKRSSTVICPGNSPKADHELRLKPDHPMGSGHSAKALFYGVDQCETLPSDASQPYGVVGPNFPPGRIKLME